MKIAVTTLVFCVAALLSLGMVILYSATMAGTSRLLIMQLIWAALGFFLCVGLAATDEEHLKRLAVPLLICSTILLTLVFLPVVGGWTNGARRWLHFGKINLQPSELAKIALILTVAWYGDRYQRVMPTFWRGLALPGAFIALIIGLIFVEPDRGTSILLAAVSGIMLLVGGVRWRYVLPLGLVVCCALAYSLTHDTMRSHRIAGWLNPEEHKSGVGFQAYQGMLALGSGGWTGLGLGNGRQKLGFIPEHHTDFILAVIGEELGLVATLLVVLGYVLIVICGLYISLRASSPFGMLLGTGITFLIGLQAFINIGVVTSTLPNKGLPLPFVSYGGSNLLMMLAAVGILLSLARQARAPEALREDSDVEAAFAPQTS
jgi:cell division protein FtsW